MKNMFTFKWVLILLVSVTFASCSKDDNNGANNGTDNGTDKYFINYGSYSGSKSTVTAYDSMADTVTNGFYETANDVKMISNAQYAYQYNGKIYFMGNNADQIYYVDENTFEQKSNGITSSDIVKPRYCIGYGDYLYISCWGGDIWNDLSLSYIIKLNINTEKVEEKITLHGGPEGLAIANNKLYAALGYKDSVAVINLSNSEVSFIATPAVTSFFRKDNNENLYVSLISTYSNFSNETGIGYINTTTDNLDAVYKLEGVSSTYDNVIVPNSDFSKIYVMTSAYDENWNLSGAVAVFNTSSKTFESDLFVDGVSAINGVAVDGSDVFVFISEGVTGNGLAKKYKEDGTFVKNYETGISPYLLLNID